MICAVYCPADLTAQKEYLESLCTLKGDNTQEHTKHGRSRHDNGNKGGRNDRNNRNDEWKRV